MAEEKETSAFGKGLTYCLGLFLAHSERSKEFEKSYPNMVHLWFNDAADHFFELVIPDTLPICIKDRLTVLQDKCLRWRLDDCTDKDREWALSETKALLVEIDKHFGIPAIKGEWE